MVHQTLMEAAFPTLRSSDMENNLVFADDVDSMMVLRCLLLSAVRREGELRPCTQFMEKLLNPMASACHFFSPAPSCSYTHLETPCRQLVPRADQIEHIHQCREPYCTSVSSAIQNAFSQGNTGLRGIVIATPLRASIIKN